MMQLNAIQHTLPRVRHQRILRHQIYSLLASDQQIFARVLPHVVDESTREGESKRPLPTKPGANPDVDFLERCSYSSKTYA